MLGAEVRAAKSGSKTLKDATNEAIRDWIAHPNNTHYIIGSVVGPHPYPDMVAKLQSVISKEIKIQLSEHGLKTVPDRILACVGGGSNAAGAFYEFINDDCELILAEAAGKGIDSGYSAATSILGTTGILHASKTLLMQTSEGQVIEPHSISAGLDYPGIGPMHAHLIQNGRAQSIAITDDQAIQAATLLSRLEGIIPALETAHAFALLEHIPCKKEDINIINLSGRGDKDLDTFMKYIDYE